MDVRVARPTADLARAVAFYRDALGLPLLASFEDHDGYSGAILGLPDASRQLELVRHAGVRPAPTDEDQLVLYGAAGLAARLEAAGHEPRSPANPYWERNGAVGFVDPDGYWLILAP
jgi:catechol 2,3-dioxygenase-like lactoylglutathione lyase family enzyme